MEIYEIISKLKDEPCYKALTYILDTFFNAKDLAIANIQFDYILGFTSCLACYNKISKDEFKKIFSLVESNIKSRFSDYELDVKIKNVLTDTYL